MAGSQAYRVPPIVEATIEFRLSEKISQKKIEVFSRKLGGTYPNVTDDLSIDFTFRADMDAEASIKKKVLGKRHVSSDQTRTILVQHGTLIVTMIAPYPGWIEFYTWARGLFDDFREVVGPIPLSRIGLRYINRLDIPLSRFPVVRPSAVLNYLPSVPQFLEPEILGYLIQHTSRLHPSRYFVNLVSTLVDSPVPDAWSLVLDIDVARDIDVPRRSADIGEELQAMRDVKNEIFEACITQAYREIIS